MNPRLIFLIISYLFSTQTAGLFAQNAYRNQSKLSLETIMQGERFIGYSPDNIVWGLDSRTVFFKWNPDFLPDKIWYQYDISSKKISAVDSSNYPNLQHSLAFGGNYSPDFGLAVWEEEGDLWVWNRQSGQVRKIWQTWGGYESNPHFLDNERLAFAQNGNLYLLDLKNISLRQLTRFEKSEPKPSKEPNPAQSWLQAQQKELFSYVREQQTKRQFNDSLQKKLQASPARTNEQQPSSLLASPKADFVLYTVATNKRGAGSSVAYYVNESGFVENKQYRDKVGFQQFSSKLGVYSVEKDSYYLLNTSQLAGIYDKPAFLREYHRDTAPYQPLYKNEKPSYVAGYQFNPQGKAYAEIRSCDNKERWLVGINLATGQPQTIDRQSDSAWVGGVGIQFSQTGWVDSSRIWFISNESGFPHLYIAQWDGKGKKALTKGNFEVSNVVFDQQAQRFYLHSSQRDLGEKHLYQLDLADGRLQPYGQQEGGYEGFWSLDRQFLAFRYSDSRSPWELFIQKNEPQAQPEQITRSTTEQFNSYAWQKPQIVEFVGSKGELVRGRLYQPSKKNKLKKAVLFVHGAGYLQNAHRWWSVYFREYMFHHFLADNGYTVLDVDYHGSAGYGSQFRTSIYRNMGGADLDDFVYAADFLGKKYQIDKDKICIYGGSYGGFITLMGLFTKPQTFACGAALRSVTDWAHYNHGYTSNILNSPTEDSLAFVRSSPIYHAQGLQKPLLMLHGAVDDNVQYQDIIRLSQKLIELQKNRWELAVYPVENHSFTEPLSWIDEYKRIYLHFENNSR